MRILFLLIMIAATALANNQDDLNEFYKDLKCLECGSLTIYESESNFSTDLKKYIAEEYNSGRSLQDIKQELVAKYGNEILMTPPESSILWYLPFLILLLLVGVFMYKLTKNRRA